MRWTERQRAMLRAMHVVVPDLDRGDLAVIDDEADVERGSAAATASTSASTSTSTSTSTSAFASTPASTPASPTAPALAAREPAPTVTRAPAAVAPVATVPLVVDADWLVVVDGHDAGAPEGQLLERMLASIGVAREGAGRSTRATCVALDPGVDAAAHAHEVAIARAAAKPRLAIAFGRAAAKALVGSDEPIGSLRGRVHGGDGGFSVVVTFALAYLLRHPLEKAKAWADLCLAAGTIDAAPAA